MTIPAPVIASVVDVLTDAYSWSKLDMDFAAAGCPGDAPEGSSKAARCMAWLRRVNAEVPDEALGILGRLLHTFMEEVLSSEPARHPWSGKTEESPAERRDKQRRASTPPCKVPACPTPVVGTSRGAGRMSPPASFTT